MAISATNLTTALNHTAGSSAASASISPASSWLVLAFLATQSNTLVNTPTASGCGLTWVVVGRVTNGVYELTVFRALGTTPTAGAVTFDTAAENRNKWAWSILQYSGIDTSGTNGSGAVVQSASKFDIGTTSTTVTLGAFANAANATTGATYMAGANQTISPGAGFSEEGQAGDGAFQQQIESEFRTDNDTTVNWSWSAAADSISFGLEIKAASALPEEDFWNVPIVQPQEFLVSIW